MSLFADSRYRWRETYFVLLRSSNRPAPSAVETMLQSLGPSYDWDAICTDAAGEFESVTIRAPQDFAAMDVTYVSGEEVLEDIDEWEGEGTVNASAEEWKDKIAEMRQCDARFELYHFEEIACEDEDGCLDPGSLLTLLRGLIALTGGIGIDPQAGTII